MASKFAEIEPEKIQDNVFKLVGTDWMLITAGTRDSFNTMTGGWGGFGVLWGKKACFCVIRPHRYTYEFMEKADHFTLSFFEEKYRGALELCGSKSGRDMDKVGAAGLTAVEGTSGAIYFAEARLVLECRKIYYHDLDPDHFLDPQIHENYPAKDYHRMYIGEIVKCLRKR